MSLAAATQRYILQRKEDAGSTDSSFVTLLQKCASTDDHARRSEYAREFLRDNSENKTFIHAEEYFPLRTWVQQVAGKKKRADSLRP
jgi:CRISPR/Cas system-associated endonuclease Cas1